MTTTEWVRERAAKLVDGAREVYGVSDDDFVLDTEEADAMVGRALQEAIERGEKNVTSRLENPDEALVEAVAKAHCDNDWPCQRCRENAEASLRALALTLK